MRHLPGWVVGALGTAAVVGSFYAGSALNTNATAPLYAADAPTATAPADLNGLHVECEPGQRAVVRQATALGAGTVTCVSVTPAPAPVASYAAASAQAVRANYIPSGGGHPAPAVINEPVEVYRPRATPVTYRSSDVSPPARSVKKSVVIIASSTAAGATIGALAKGKKGAFIGGILGGGAATVWDQVTRRRDDGR